MDFFDVIKKRRCIRDIEKVKIPKEDIIKILECGRLAPSGMNIQPWEFIVIDDEEKIKQLSKVQTFIIDASVVIGIIVDPNESKYYIEDISAAAENIFLAITALGYATCWVEGTLLRQEDFVKKLLNIPKNKNIMIIFPIGKAKRIPQMPQKKELSSIVFYNEYGKKYL